LQRLQDGSEVINERVTDADMPCNLAAAVPAGELVPKRGLYRAAGVSKFWNQFQNRF